MGKKHVFVLALAILIAVPAISQTGGTAQASQSAQRSQRAVFAGEWKVGTGAGNSTFLITLASDGTATKSMGAGRGTWEVVGAEARISWDDGWHDVIRKAGNHYEKAAYAPGKSYTDAPSNITGATRTQPL